MFVSKTCWISSFLTKKGLNHLYVRIYAIIFWVKNVANYAIYRCKILGLKIRVCKKLDKYHVWPLGSPTRTPWPLGTPLTYPLNLDPLGPYWHLPWPPGDYLHAPFFLSKNDILAKKNWATTPPLMSIGPPCQNLRQFPHCNFKLKTAGGVLF